MFKSALEDMSLNLPSHRIVLAAVPARAANANENNIADDFDGKHRRQLSNKRMDEQYKWTICLDPGGYKNLSYSRQTGNWKDCALLSHQVIWTNKYGHPLVSKFAISRHYGP